MHFSRQLSVFVQAGIPIMEALQVIAEETTDKLLQRALLDMIDRIQAGDTFASAAAAHPEAFPNYYVGMLTSAELTGNLDIVLDQLGDYIDREHRGPGKITGAMIYPAVVAVMAVVVVVVLATFVMPKFVVFFKSFNAKLPLPTRMLLSASNFVSTWWFAILGVIVFAVVGIIALRRSRSGKAWLDSMVLKLPVVGDLVRTAVIERICRILSSMIRAGVALPDAMRVTAESSNNAVYREGLSTVRDEMMEGQGLAEPLARTGLFPGAARQMFRVGEETGTLDAPARHGRHLLRQGARREDQAVHRPLRASGHHLHGRHRRLRGGCPGVRHVRHLPSGQGHITPKSQGTNNRNLQPQKVLKRPSNGVDNKDENCMSHAKNDLATLERDEVTMLAFSSPHLAGKSRSN